MNNKLKKSLEEIVSSRDFLMKIYDKSDKSRGYFTLCVSEKHTFWKNIP